MEPRCLASAAPVVPAATVLTTATETYYVSPNGSTSNLGTATSPWPSVAYALSQVGGGHTIILEPGTYGPILIYNGYGGTSTSPTVIKSQYKWQAVIDGSIGSLPEGVANDFVGNDYITYDGLKVINAKTFGIDMGGNSNSTINCWVSGSALSGIVGWNHNNLTVSNNLVEYNGTDPNHDHGIYISGYGLTVTGNVVRHNASCGIGIGSLFQNAVVSGNLVYGQKADIAYNTVGQETWPRSMSITNNFMLDASTGGLLLWGVNFLKAWKGNVVATSISGVPLDAIVSNNVSDYSAILSKILPAAKRDYTPPKGSVYDSGLSGDGAPMVMVRYTDDQSINPMTINETNILIKGPNGYSMKPSAVRYMLLRDGNTLDVMYLLAPPPGGWTSAYNGTFTVNLANRQITDLSSNFAPPGKLGTFTMTF